MKNKYKVYKVQMHVRCTEEDSLAIKKHLAQAVFDELELEEDCAVYDVKVKFVSDVLMPDEDPLRLGWAQFSNNELL